MNKIALVTGGATGIGKETAKKLASEGVTVVITGRRENLGFEAVKEIESVAANGARVEFIRNDVTNEEEVKKLIDGIVEKYGRLDYAVNNAGTTTEQTTIMDSDTNNFKTMVDTNIYGVYFGMKYELMQMVKQGEGSIVNLCSIAGLNGIAYSGTYCATKHAVVGLTKSAAIDHAQQGVRVNGVAPGAIKTEILAKQLNGDDPNYNEEIMAALHPMNRMGQPNEIANGIAWLLSDEASFVTGHILNIDGGFQAK